MAHQPTDLTLQPAKQLPNCSGDDIYYQTLDRHPAAWYEERQYLMGLGILITATGWWLQTQMSLFPNLWVSLLGLLTYIFGWLYDICATGAVMRLKERFDKANIEFPLVESGLFLPKYPTIKQQILSLHTATELIFFAFSLLLPSFGLAAGTEHFLAGCSNRRNVKRIHIYLAILNLKE